MIHTLTQHPIKPLKDWRKIGRVLGILSSSPRELIYWLRFSLLNSKSPLELGIPWWSFKSIWKTEKILHKNIKVFEFGTGGSSIYFARRARRIECVEDEDSWATDVRQKAQSMMLTNLIIYHKKFNFFKPSKFKSSDYLQTLNDTDYDVIIVDGKEEAETVRDICFWKAENHLKKGGIIILDDSWRYPQIFKKNRALRIEKMKGLGPCRLGVTETSFFYY